MAPIELGTAAGYWRRIIALSLLFGGMGLVIGAAGVQRGMPLAVAFAVVVAGVPAWMLLRRRAWAGVLDGDGVQLRNGRRFAWADFQKVVAVHAQRGGARWLNHYELVFRDGRARIFHRMLENEREVLAFIAALERGDNPLAARRG